mgnify:CR=1 FL=1
MLRSWYPHQLKTVSGTPTPRCYHESVMKWKKAREAEWKSVWSEETVMKQKYMKGLVKRKHIIHCQSCSIIIQLLIVCSILCLSDWIDLHSGQLPTRPANSHSLRLRRLKQLPHQKIRIHIEKVTPISTSFIYLIIEQNFAKNCPIAYMTNFALVILMLLNRSRDAILGRSFEISESIGFWLTIFKSHCVTEAQHLFT